MQGRRTVRMVVEMRNHLLLIDPASGRSESVPATGPVTCDPADCEFGIPDSDAWTGRQAPPGLVVGTVGGALLTEEFDEQVRLWLVNPAELPPA